MSVLSKELRPTIDVVVKNHKGEEDTITVFAYNIMGDGEDINIDTFGTTEHIKYWTRTIKSWTYTDENGAPLPVNTENVSLLPIEVIGILDEAREGKALEAKKNTKTTPPLS